MLWCVLCQLVCRLPSARRSPGKDQTAIYKSTLWQTVRVEACPAILRSVSKSFASLFDVPAPRCSWVWWSQLLFAFIPCLSSWHQSRVCINDALQLAWNGLSLKKDTQHCNTAGGCGCFGDTHTGWQDNVQMFIWWLAQDNFFKCVHLLYYIFIEQIFGRCHLPDNSYILDLCYAAKP